MVRDPSNRAVLSSRSLPLSLSRSRSLSLSLCFSSPENLLQNSVEDTWTDSNLNRVSVIQFQEETKGEEEEDDEAAAERRVRQDRAGTLLRTS